MKNIYIIVGALFISVSLFSQEGLLENSETTKLEEEIQIQKPDPNRIMAELSARLRLSSKQEEKIISAVKDKSEEFDKYLKEYEKANEQAKKYRLKMNELKYKMYKISIQMPDVIRDFLDEEQRETYDKMIIAKNKSKSKKSLLSQEDQQTQIEEKKPVKKKRLIRRKKKKLPGGETQPTETYQLRSENLQEPAGSVPTGQQAPSETITEEEPNLGSYP